MDFSISKEVFILLSSSLSGALISVIFDLFKLLRKKAHTGTILSAIHDIVFWIIATAIMFFTVFYVSNGRLRWYQFLGAISGSLLYFLILSRPLSFFLERFFDIFFKFFEFFLKILLTPLKITYNILDVSLSFLISPIVRILKKLIKKIIFSIRKNMKTIKFTI